VAAILDEMSTACFLPECNLITFRPDNWREVLEERPPHFLFVESAWHGNGGSWQYKIGRYDHPSATGLSELLDWCQRRDIPTVFWNKEDPVHFDKFKDAARQFDVVFTTDADVIPRYEALGIDQVDALLFAAQPRLHNPIWAGPRAREPVFAGSYYGNRHHERRVQQEDLLDAARRFDLVIYDRNWGSQDPAYQFPDRFLPHIKGRLPYEELSRVHRLHRVFLNVNSVIDSPTMLSRRVFELLACGTAVVSTPSRALDEIFGELVPTVASTEEAEPVLEALLDDDERWRDLTERGIRFVLSKHTYRHRLAQIAATLGFAEAADPHEQVAAFATVRDLGEARVVVDTVSKQTAPVRELILGAGKGVEDVEVEALAGRTPDLSVRLLTQLDGASQRARARDLAQLTDADWLWAVDPSHPADPDQLLDLASCLTFAEADAIGESLPDASDGAGLHRFTSQINPRGALVRRVVVAERGWDLEATADELRTWVAQGLRFYCARRPAAGAATARAPERVGELG
jgi:spore maturation protein CgeB